MLKEPNLFTNGFHLTYFPLSDEIKKCVTNENWTELDAHFKTLTAPEGSLFKFLNRFHDFQSIEFMISIRDSNNEWEEDGIWHDDGSRVFAFSLSLTLNASEIKGGRLEIKNTHQEKGMMIPTPEVGGIILFLTGLYGFVHKIHRVEKGRRIIIAGWCS